MAFLLWPLLRLTRPRLSSASTKFGRSRSASLQSFSAACEVADHGAGPAAVVVGLDILGLTRSESLKSLMAQWSRRPCWHRPGRGGTARRHRPDCRPAGRSGLLMVGSSGQRWQAPPFRHGALGVAPAGAGGGAAASACWRWCRRRRRGGRPAPARHGAAATARRGGHGSRWRRRRSRRGAAAGCWGGAAARPRAGARPE